MADRDKQFEAWFGPGAGQPFSTVQAKSGSESPTSELYADFDFISQFLSERLFAGGAPKTVITFNRRRRSTAYMATDAFESIAGTTAHELSFNIAKLRQRDDRFTMSVVACAMAAAWRFDLARQENSDRRPTRGYCDRRLAGKLEEIGLVPSDTGEPGGKRTGYRLSYYIAEGGPFDLDARELLATGFRIRWRDHPIERGEMEGADAEAVSPRVKNSRTRFMCPNCTQLAWASACAALDCGVCNLPLIAS